MTQMTLNSQTLLQVERVTLECIVAFGVLRADNLLQSRGTTWPDLTSDANLVPYAGTQSPRQTPVPEV